MAKQVGIPDHAELIIHGTRRLSPEQMGIELGVKILDAGRNPVPGWTFRVNTAAGEIMSGETDAKGEFRSRRIALIRQGTQEGMFLVIEGSAVSDWKKVPAERELTAGEIEEREDVARREQERGKKERLRGIWEGRGGTIKEGEEVALQRGEYIMRETIHVDAGGKLLIKPGVLLKFTEGKGIRCRGVLIAEGTDDRPIRFKTAESDKSWGSVFLVGEGTNGSRITHCIIEGAENTETEYGGGILLERASGIEILNLTLEGNSAQYGGGIACYLSRAIMRGLKVENNQAAKAGGGIYIIGGEVEVEDFQVTGNHAAEGGGIAIANEWRVQEMGQLTSDLEVFRLKMRSGQINKNNATNEGGGLHIATEISGMILTGNIEDVRFKDNKLTRQKIKRYQRQIKCRIFCTFYGGSGEDMSYSKRLNEENTETIIIERSNRAGGTAMYIKAKGSKNRVSVRNAVLEGERHTHYLQGDGKNIELIQFTYPSEEDLTDEDYFENEYRIQKDKIEKGLLQRREIVVAKAGMHESYIMCYITPGDAKITERSI